MTVSPASPGRAAAGDGAKFTVQPAEFYSRGARIAADMYVPTQPPGVVVPGIVVCHGFGSIRKYWVNDIAAELACRGLAALIFDYRGFGDSGGERDRLFPMEQVEDVQAAMTFLGTRPGVDPSRLGLYGISFGGAVAVHAAGIDARARATVCAVGIADGGDWLRSLRRHWEWLEFEHALEEDRRNRVLTGSSRVVDPGEIMVRDPGAEAISKQLDRDFPERRYRLTLESADAIIEFRPVGVVGRIAPRAVLFVGVDGDKVTPAEHTDRLYRAAGEPKERVMLTGLSHHDVYRHDRLTDLVDRVAAFYRIHLA
jgi:uncharacterized protein